MNLTGVLPFLRSKGFPFGIGGIVAGKRISSLPRTPVCGPVIADTDCIPSLLNAAAEINKSEPDCRIQIKSTIATLNSEESRVVKIPWRETYTLSLPDSHEELRFGNKTRNHRIKSAVSKAEKSGIKIRLAENETDLKAWYQLYLETMRSVAVPARPYRLFKYMFEKLKPAGMMRLLLAELNDNKSKRLLTGSIFLSYNKTFYYAFNGRKLDEPALHQNDYVLYTAIKTARQEGFKYFDFGEVTSDNEGLARFKSKWGCDTKQLYHYYHPLPEDFDIKTVDSGSNGSSLRKLIWKKLPLNVTQILGDKIYQYL
ncbi:MAG: GNAT family N-acetyltransferase [Ignavibacteriales bacterium]|nr:MAG: GNAT family N-acetyltransferase [Ignavibacteriales bacterium]